MIHPKEININDYSYVLPEDRIAKFPLPKRDESKLLVYDHGNISEDVFKNITEHLPENMLMVCNNTKVIQARLMFHKQTGAHIEVFCLTPYQPNDYALAFLVRGECVWQCMVGNAKKWKDEILHRDVSVDGKNVVLSAERLSDNGRSMLVRFSWSEAELNFGQILEAAGVLPIPPYLKRDTQESDKDTYQTVYSKIKGSVAAPTAGLHFTDEVFSKLEAHGVIKDEVTLHVGAGTFQPVKSEHLEQHTMHTEIISVGRSTIKNIADNLGHIVAVGTTSVRTLESLYYFGAIVKKNPDVEPEDLKVLQWMPYDGDLPALETVEALNSLIAYLDRNDLEVLNASTQIIIAPGYKFKIVNMMITNFHQPENTLMLLVAAFVGPDWKKIYNYALNNNFRFLSYGDSSLLMPGME